MRRLTVNGHSERWLRQGFPWVYPKEVIGKPAKPGEAVTVVSQRGVALGTGFADDGFLAARVLRHEAGVVDAAWVAAVVARAVALRDVLLDEQTDGYRLVNAESDGIPGVRIDRWASWFVITLDSPSLAPLLPWLRDALIDRFPTEGVVFAYRPDPRDRRQVKQWTPRPGLLWGDEPTGEVTVHERGLRFAVDPMTGPDVGLYADMRQVRATLEPFWKATRVLNLFAYTGAFSVAAAAHGASEVVTVDLSRKVLERAKRNMTLNDLPVDDDAFVAEDCFKVLDRLRRQGRRFDRVIVDPPSMSRGEAVFSGTKDGSRLFAAAARVLATDGWLVAASNQGKMSPKVFDGVVADGLHKAGRKGQLLWALGQGPDFPAGTWFPEGRYLKVRVLRLNADAQAQR